ncbi:YdbL family protein [Idiomarina sp. HP20-50]|uniref:YdbL family protein n=1 Tax=Idiomarina sp. HP20-50 TaxID=3070813 RepID=UPI00294ACD04|nr:YdbL family protein [Idiomarina sp. HP20-50]MDV6315160.1 YdbL family protein [Idiomarina sp. HP20-50]
MRLIASGIFIALLATAGMTHSTAAFAQELTLQEAKEQLQEAKDNGLVGEQPNGYLGTVASSARAEQIAEQINEARRKEYVRIADTNDIAVADVELLAGKRAIERTDSGHYIKVDGQWKKKP